MSRNFSAEQFEHNFLPPRLGNWETCKWYPHVRPRARRGHTRIIADDRGHLLPGVPRLAPWGHFKSTWQLPRRITRKLAKELSSSGIVGDHKEKKLQTSWEKRSSHHPLTEQESSTPPLPPPTKKERKISATKKEIPVVEEKEVEYQRCSNKDEHDYTNPVGYDKTPKVINTSQRVREDLESYSKSCRIQPENKNLLEKLTSNNAEKHTFHEERFDNGSMKSDQSLKSKDSGKGGSVKSIEKKHLQRNRSPKGSSVGSLTRSSLSTGKPLEADFVSSQYAKELAQNNLKHRPLPDAVEDKLFRALQMQQAKHPGADLESFPTASAVGHKKYVSPGPTQCSKLKVYRPKTAAPMILQKHMDDDRPKTGKTTELNEIDLAICWDLKPSRPEDEPKRPVHIDGSNGSAAPGIFTVVKHSDDESPRSQVSCSDKNKNINSHHTKKPKPKSAWTEINEKSNPVNPSAVMDIINNNTDDIDKKITQQDPNDLGKGKVKRNNFLARINEAEENKNPNVSSLGSTKNSKNSATRKSSKNESLDTSINTENFDPHKNSARTRSSPNLSMSSDEKPANDKMCHSRPCLACDTKNPLSPKSTKQEYKMAFKAGIPNSKNSSNCGSSSSNRPHTAKPMHVPKPKTPFARNSYSINTLAPPFSLRPGTTGMDYPEHWRLSSVYQQSYKPVELRKNPMIKGIFR